MHNLSYYKTIASFYDTVVPRDIKGICDSIEAIINKYEKKKEILDLGCGTGRFTSELAKRGCRMIGLDITDEMLEVARRSAKKANVKVRFIKGDVRNFKLKKRMDIIWARGSIGDLVNLNDLKRAFKNIRNNLLRHGIFIFDVRDYSDFLKTYKNGCHRETRILKQKNKTYKFSFIVKMKKKSRIAHINGRVTVGYRNNSETYKISHMMRSFTEKEITKLLSEAGFKFLEILPGYKFERRMKPGTRIIAVTQKQS